MDNDIKKKYEVIKIRAKELGFDAIGVCSPDLSSETKNHFLTFLENGHHGEMHYLKRGDAKRLDLDLVLPGVKSIICLRTPYLTRNRSLDDLDQKESGDISCYAWGDDYHEIIQERLRCLAKTLEDAFAGCQTKIYVDTGPVLEKPLAQKAGLGWVGKHTNLVTVGTGSWYFLSEILIDIKLPQSIPSEDRCGTCSQCIDICPTQAIIAPYVLDARKCISYLTIELKGAIPTEFRQALGNRIFGCDDCQIVCPWNSFAEMIGEKAFAPRPDSFELMELMSLDDEAFRKRFKDSPIKRLKRRGFLRNVAIALGNARNPEAVPVLIEALKDKESLIRGHAVWAIGEILGERAIEIVTRSIPNEQDESVLSEIEQIKTRCY